MDDHVNDHENPPAHSTRSLRCSCLHCAPPHARRAGGGEDKGVLEQDIAAASLGDDDALEQLLNPGINRYRLETLQLSVHTPLGRAMHHPAYTFLKKISHTADSQDQRHRMVPGSRPLLTRTVPGFVDVVEPELIATDPACHELFRESVEAAWDARGRLLQLGVSPELALYLLPNAKALRYTESVDLLNFRHKAAMRLCYNAQEEIWRLTLEESQQIAERFPRIGRFLLPPCGHRRLAASGAPGVPPSSVVSTDWKS